MLGMNLLGRARPTNSPFLSRMALTSLVVFFWIIFLQWSGGGYTSEFIGYPDESAHYVSGLMVHDYLHHLISFESVSPLKFASDFYDYYPRVSIGHWPP